MASQAPSASDMQQTLGLTGITINAMALIAPGAFLWTTFQTQSVSGGTSMWAAVFVAVLIALLTAITYAALANRYPEAGTGSSYYYAEVAVLHKEEHRHFKFARLSKFIVGWASHLYYWIYPGVMVAFMGLVIEYIVQQSFNPGFGTGPGGPFELIAICVTFSIVVGAIALVGVTGSTVANIIINAIQILALLTFSLVAIVFRMNHPELHYTQSSALDVFTPKSFNDLLFQSTIAILLVVGFESATALAAESKNPQRDIPRGVVLSLIIQGIVFYFFEYFAANFVIGDYYKNASGTGFAAAAASGAPIGDIAQFIGDRVFDGNGAAFAVILAATVVIALVGTALSCLNTGVRVTYAMGKDGELPAVFGFLHGKYRTPHIAVIVLVVVSASVGSYGVLSIDNLLQVTLVSNIGTFLLYGMTCIICLIAFAGVAGRNKFSTIIAPILGATLNFAMLVGVLYYAIVGAANTRTDTIVAGAFSVTFLVLGFAFLYMRQLISGVPILHPENHKAKLTATPRFDVVVTGKLGPLVKITGLLPHDPSLEGAGDTENSTWHRGPLLAASLETVPRKPVLQNNAKDALTTGHHRSWKPDTFDANSKEVRRQFQKPYSHGSGDTRKPLGSAQKPAVHLDEEVDNEPTLRLTPSKRHKQYSKNRDIKKTQQHSSYDWGIIPPPQRRD
jgi:amino acid transporter